MSDDGRDEETAEVSDDAERSEAGRTTPGRRVVGAGAVAILALLAFGMGRWSSGGGGLDNGSEEGAPAGGDAAEASSGESAQQYTCPMHSDVRSDDPDDTCPICGMDLVAVGGASGGEKREIPSLALSDRAIEVAKVRTDRAERRPLSREIEAYGRVEVAEEAETEITSWVRGRIEHLDIRAVGQRIHRGQRIARLYSPKLESVQKELLQALRTAEGADSKGEPSARERSARSAVEAARSRLRVLGMEPEQIDEVVEEREVREIVDVYAETAGTVRKRPVAEGDWVDAGDALAALHGLDTVWIQLEIYERDLPFVDEGTPATVGLPNRPDVELEGRIAFVDPVVDPKNGTARARIVASNDEGRLPPGSDVRATIEATLDGDPPPVSVPESAVLWTGPRSVVYRYDRSMDPPAFVPKEVELGPKAGDRRVVRAGLSKGDEVATHGAFRLDAELQIRGEPSMMTGLPPSQQVGEGVEGSE